MWDVLSWCSCLSVRQRVYEFEARLFSFKTSKPFSRTLIYQPRSQGLDRQNRGTRNIFDDLQLIRFQVTLKTIPHSTGTIMCLDIRRWNRILKNDKTQNGIKHNKSS